MARKNPYRAELDELHAELAAPAASAGAADPSHHAPDLGAMLHELSRKLADAAEDAEDIVMAHPLTAVGAAFLIGFAVARLTGRR
jgi:ElaB/YqjD/DUF883 family membrane-anchored ribosome-binding protein